jgi:D-alanine-D-alanine ligase
LPKSKDLHSASANCRSTIDAWETKFGLDRRELPFLSYKGMRIKPNRPQPDRKDFVTLDKKKVLRVGVLFGGRSGEHEVSLVSAASVIRGLDPDKYEAVPIGITKDGHWLIGEGAVKMLPEVLKGGRRVMLTADPTEAAIVPLDRGAGAQRLDVVFPVLHGTYGEDGTIQGMLDLAGLPYVGAGVLGSAVGMDKDVSKKLLKADGIPVVPWVAVHRSDWEKDPEAVRAQAEAEFDYPMFVKPATLGSSVGMTKVHGAEEFAPANTA